MAAPSSITVTPVFVADLFVEGERMPIYVHVIDHPEAGPADLLPIVSGPDFPTGGIIYGTQGIRDCYLTGPGLIKKRAKEQV